MCVLGVTLPDCSGLLVYAIVSRKAIAWVHLAGHHQSTEVLWCLWRGMWYTKRLSRINHVTGRLRHVKVLVVQLCFTLCNPMDCSPTGFSVHGISQARILEWVAISFSRGSS